MGLKNFFKKQLSTVIEWKDQSPEIVLQKALTPTDEIKNASKLIVSPGQGCLLVYEGKVQDVLTEPNTYNLDSDNRPFITTLLKLRQLFESEHKMQLYFFRTAEFVNMGWGTSSPVKYVDKDYGFPVELSAYGNFSLLLSEPQRFFSEVMGAAKVFTTGDLQELMISRINPAIGSLLAKGGYSIKNMYENLSKISEDLKVSLAETIQKLGFTLTDFRIENTTFNEETMLRINKIADIKAEALQAAEVGLDYVELEKLRALRDAARNEGGLAGAGLQLGVGMELGKVFTNEKDKATSDASGDEMTTLKKLKLLLDENILTQAEFDEKKKEILSKI
ncbi:MAG: SPFH domain-containing protein [Dysgonamonadaceae bacterium]|nr:SPFH domain-containing protein [Dysgonamonadaceae bacterium]